MVSKKKLRVVPNIENQQVLAETGRRSYEMLRLTRVKYFENPYTFIDLRLFQRGWDSESDKEVYHPTKKGVQLKEEQFQRLVGKWTLVPSLLFHPIIIKKAYPALRREEFDTAVFRAFKALEMRVRKLSKLPSELYGTSLMRKAFDAEKGPLTDKATPKAEREAMSHLFAGMIGCYKNPHSHREVELEFNEAFEMLLVASHLFRVLEKVEKRIADCSI